MSEAKITGIEIEVKFFLMEVYLFLCKPRIEVDGQLYLKYWGTHFFELPPGAHTIAVYFRYLGRRQCGLSSLTVELPAGKVVRIRYRVPNYKFGRGSLVMLAENSKPECEEQFGNLTIFAAARLRERLSGESIQAELAGRGFAGDLAKRAERAARGQNFRSGLSAGLTCLAIGLVYAGALWWLEPFASASRPGSPSWVEFALWALAGGYVLGGLLRLVKVLCYGF